MPLIDVRTGTTAEDAVRTGRDQLEGPISGTKPQNKFSRSLKNPHIAGRPLLPHRLLRNQLQRYLHIQLPPDGEGITRRPEDRVP